MHLHDWLWHHTSISDSKQNKQKCKWKLTLQRHRGMRIWTILQQLLQTSWLNTRNLVFHSLQLSNHVFRVLHSQGLSLPDYLLNDWNYSNKSHTKQYAEMKAWESFQTFKKWCNFKLKYQKEWIYETSNNRTELLKTQSRYRASWLSI